MDASAEVSRYSAEGIVDWYSDHAEYLKGDEASDEYYSDDESEEDPIDLKRTRKEVTSILRSHTQGIRKKTEIIARKQFKEAVVGEPKISSGAVYCPIENVERPFDLADDVSRIDPLTETRIDHRKTTDYDPTLGQTSRTFQTWLIYNPTPLVRDYLITRHWKVNVGIGLFFALLGLIMMYIAWKNLSVYMDFQWAIPVLFAPVVVHQFIMAMPLHRILSKSVIYSLVVGVAIVCYTILMR